MNANFVAVIKRIIAVQGEDILSNPQRMKGYVNDYAAHESKIERLAFGRCIEYGAYMELKNASDAGARVAVKATVAQRVHGNEGLDIALCNDALDVLEAAVFGEKNLCKQCGKELQEGWVSCPFCGAGQSPKVQPGIQAQITQPKKKNKVLPIAIAGVAVLVAAGIFLFLKKNENPVSSGGLFVSGSDVYVAGYEETDEGCVAKYWKNGKAVNLTDGKSSAGAYSIGESRAGAYSIFVSGSDVYVAGYESIVEGLFAKYWKNGKAVNLTDGKNDGIAISIFVSDSDVYVAGYETTDEGKNIATYWKNGEAVYLTDGKNYSGAFSIFISGSDVYVAGYEDTGEDNAATYWKNGKAVNLTDGKNDSVASSIFISGSDVYVAGYESIVEGPVAKYWKNGKAVNLTDGESDAEIFSIFVSGSDVYVAEDGIGWVSGNGVMKYWKNGQPVELK
jgi:hypothetical protein